MNFKYLKSLWHLGLHPTDRRLIFNNQFYHSSKRLSFIGHKIYLHKIRTARSSNEVSIDFEMGQKWVWFIILVTDTPRVFPDISFEFTVRHFYDDISEKMRWFVLINIKLSCNLSFKYHLSLYLFIFYVMIL